MTDGIDGELDKALNEFALSAALWGLNKGLDKPSEFDNSEVRTLAINKVKQAIDHYASERERRGRIDELKMLVPEPVAEMASINYEDELKRTFDNIRERITNLNAEREK